MQARFAETGYLGKKIMHDCDFSFSRYLINDAIPYKRRHMWSMGPTLVFFVKIYFFLNPKTVTIDAVDMCPKRPYLFGSY